MHQLRIFISYSWKNESIINSIDNDLSQIGINLIRDVKTLRLTENIEEFMSTIRESDLVLLLISEEYLKSPNCMFEVLELLKEKEYKNIIIPIFINQTSVSTPEERLYYLEYWIKKEEHENKRLSNIDPKLVIKEYEELSKVTKIKENINAFLIFLKYTTYISYKDLKNENYNSIFEKIDTTISFGLSKLLHISKIEDQDKKETFLDDWFDKNKPNGFAYFFRAIIANERGNFYKACFNYNKSIEIMPLNFEAINNLGYIYMENLNQYDKAKSLFEQAIDLNPSYLAPRINLASLYQDKLKLIDKANIEFKKILNLKKEKEAFRKEENKNLLQFLHSEGGKYSNPDIFLKYKGNNDSSVSPPFYNYLSDKDIEMIDYTARELINKNKFKEEEE